MTKKEFWHLIDNDKTPYSFLFTDERLTTSGKRVISPIAEKLAFLEGFEIAAWFQIFREYYRIADTSLLRLAGHVVSGNLSDHRLIEFRSWLIAGGEGVYHRALKNPETLARVLQRDGYCLSSSFKQFGYLIEYALDDTSLFLPPHSLYYLTERYPLSRETFSEIHSDIALSIHSDICWVHLTEEERQKILPSLSTTVAALRGQRS